MELASYLGIAAMLLIALAFVGGARGLSALVSPKNPTPEKLDPYECGIVPEYDPPERFPVQFYLVAVIFIAFDIETVFLYPWAVSMRKLGMFGFWEIVVFVGIVLIAYGYVRREGVLDWGPIRKLDKEQLMAQFRREAHELADVGESEAA